ncbi:hypothetical protein Bpfe_016399 [Biomphalaria pfeifferi]|uniref:Uncharacterized protein n=1 Tax=Biomphalaria pfeifferi TaxID=112525 RepID=A0AAD8BGD3_BIOPF|nr:hypothetical protein Bpfe_016399 [Biomphalaria pfeifferi]
MKTKQLSKTVPSKTSISKDDTSSRPSISKSKQKSQNEDDQDVDGSNSKSNRSRSTTTASISRLLVKNRKVSESQMSKWKPIQPDFLNFILSLLEDSLARYSFSKSGNKEVMRIEKKIRTTILNELKASKFPAEKLIDFKTMKASEEALIAEKRNLDQLEFKLSSALKKEEKENKRLLTEANSVDSTSLNMTEQYHPILESLVVTRNVLL